MTARTCMLALLAATALAGGAAFAQMPAPAGAPAGAPGGAPGGGRGPAAPAAPVTAARPAADIARDATRKPAETMAFAGVKPGMKIAEISPGGGYYTRMLSAAVGPTGRIYTLAQPGRTAQLDALAAVLPNVTVVATDYAEMKLPEPVDMFWTTENYHDLHNGATANIPGMNKAVFAALKPGGIFYVEDHSAAKGAGLAATSTLHRMDEDIAKTELTAAGFRLDAEGDLLHNPQDDKVGRNSEVGSFNSDRFMLRMKKP